MGSEEWECAPLVASRMPKEPGLGHGPTRSRMLMMAAKMSRQAPFSLLAPSFPPCSPVCSDTCAFALRDRIQRGFSALSEVRGQTFFFLRRGCA